MNGRHCTVIVINVSIITAKQLPTLPKFYVLSFAPSAAVQMADGHDEVVDAFVYLGSVIDSSGGSRWEVLHWIGIARSCMNMLERRIWKSSIRLETEICLCETYIVPVLIYGCETSAICALVLVHLIHGRTMQDLEDTIYSTHIKCGSQRNHWLFTAFPLGH